MAGREKSQRHTGKEKAVFTVHVRLFTDETFPLKSVSGDMKISELKTYMEFTTGIPVHMQRISYLDEGDLLDNSDIRSNDIVPGATLQMRVWPMWRDLIEAVATNDIEWVFKLGVNQPTDYKTPNSEYMTRRSRRAWFEERAFLALFIAAHRGHEKLCKKLIDSGADVNASTPLGRSPLHVAAAQGRGNIVDTLLERGADIDAEDEDGQTALSIAAKFGHKSCERHLFLFRWQQRAKRTKPTEEAKRMAHQFYDSAFPVWLKGDQGQIYFTDILPPDEYEGSRLSSPKRRPHPGVIAKERWLDSAETGEIGDDNDFQDGTGRLPVIREERPRRTKSGGYGFSRGDSGAPRKRPVSYDAWLSIKKANEQKVIEQRRNEEEMRRQEEEDRKRKLEEQMHSFEAWAAEKEKEKKKEEKDKRKVSKISKPAEKTQATIKPVQVTPRTRSGPTYDAWLMKKETELLDRAKQGKPLTSY